MLKVIIGVGLPGSGKTTYFNRHFHNIVSSDSTNPAFWEDVRNAVGEAADHLVVDGTNLTVSLRRDIMSFIRNLREDVEFHAYEFRVSGPAHRFLLSKNTAVRLPDEELMGMRESYRAPTTDEGFNKVRISDLTLDNLDYKVV